MGCVKRMENIFFRFFVCSSSYLPWHEALLIPSVTSDLGSRQRILSFLSRGEQIITDTFYKPTGTKYSLVYDSCYSKHIKNNIVYNLAWRLCTIISEKNLLNSKI